MAKGKNVLTTGDVAKICNVAPRTVSKWFDSGQLKGYRIPGSKDRRIPLGELLRFMKANNMPTEILPLGKIRLLVVDGGEHPTGALVETLQSRHSYDVQVARSSFEVGTAMQKMAPHVVLINLLTNGVDAHDICRNIRSNEDFAAVRIIALANRLTPPESAALLQRGFDAYVSNPADPVEVIRKIEETLAIIY
jgi:excisionase family DNA binding protein